MGKKKGFNDYKIIGDITELYAVRNNGDVFTILIDTEDLPKLIKLGYSWHVSYDKTIQGYYVHATYVQTDESGNYLRNEKGVRIQTGVKLHSIIMDTRNVVDHIFHNGLDNRKSQLRVTEYANNSSNRKGANSNNKTTGVRNVCYIKDENIYRVQIMKKGQRYMWEFSSNQFEEACEFAKKKREELFGEFAGED